MKATITPRQPSRKRQQIRGVVIGQFAGVSEAGAPLVDFPGNPAGELLSARSVERWEEKDIGREVVLMFEQDRLERPIIMGFLQPVPGNDSPVHAEVDGDRLLLTAEREIVLRCGDASITLTRAGKIILRGKYLLSRSSGANLIKGASVGIN